MCKVGNTGSILGDCVLTGGKRRTPSVLGSVKCTLALWMWTDEPHTFMQ